MSSFTSNPLAHSPKSHDNPHASPEDIAPDNVLSPALSRKKVRHEHSRILHQRSRVSKDRLRLRRKRSDIRQLVEDSSKLEDIILSALDHLPLQSLPEGEPPISTIVEQFRGYRRDIRSLEHQYNEDDDELASDEDALNTLERRFFDTCEAIVFPDGGLVSPSTSRSTSRPSRRRSKQGPSSRTTDPLYEYETKIGQANILRERINDLPHEKEEYEQEKAYLAAQGLPMDPLDLKFLDDYENILAKDRADLAAVEAEIRRLEPAAVESGMVDPLMTYFNPKSNLPNPLIFEPQSLEAQDPISEDGMEKMQIELPEAEHPIIDQKVGDTGVEGLPATSPGTQIFHWLKGLPVSVSNANRWMQPFRWMLGRSKIEPPDPSISCQFDVPHDAKLDVHVDWVYVDPTGVRRRSTGELPQQLDAETTPYLGAPPPPNSSHDTPNWVSQLSPDDCESRSI